MNPQPDTSQQLAGTDIGALLAELRALRQAVEGQSLEKPRAVPRRFTVAEVAEMNGVKEEVVLGWIHEGLLKAIDVRAAGATRPKWRITAAYLAEFDAARQRKPDAEVNRPKRIKAHADLIDPATGRLRPEYLKAPGGK